MGKKASKVGSYAPNFRQGKRFWFRLHEKGEALLRKELAALETWHLVNIIIAYRLSDQPASRLNRLSASSLIEIIVEAVPERSLTRP